MNHVLEVSDVTKKFGDLVAAADVNFSLKEGEFVSVVGPSGSGKSTILRMIAGFEEPTSGEVRIDGELANGAPPFERDTNMVFQSLALFPHFTVAENIEFGLKQSGVSKSVREEKIAEMLEIVDLDGYEDRDVTDLSGGEQQRVALARAIVNEPKIVLFDEPLASLDRKLRQRLKFELQRIQNETGITFLYVTHDQEIALSVSDRIIVLNDGHIEQIDQAKELYESPESKFVANFIGDLNAISAGTLVSEDGEVTFQIENHAQRVRLEDRPLEELAERETVDLAVRPDNLALEDPATFDPSDNDEQFGLQGVIKNRMYKGDQIDYIVDTDAGEMLVSTRIDREHREWEIDEAATVVWSPNDMLIFSGQEVVA
jgi:spermidine/putrescine transport system ATP-binding protein